MNVTKDIVRDLLPAYLAGEASADTRAAVEAYLAKDVELRQIVEAAGAYSLAPLEAPAGLETRSLKQTRRLLGRKNFWMGLALIFCLAAPIVKPLRLADLVMILGLAGWAPFLIVCRKLMATGLEAPRGWRPRILWGAVGTLAGFAVEYHLRQDIPWRQPIHFYFLPAAGLLIATMIGEKLHQIQTGPEANGPYISSLFGKEPDR
jgi:hypothetical protein